MSSPVRVAVVNDYEIVIAGIARVLEPYAERVRVVELDARRPVIKDVDVVLYDTFGQSQGGAMRVDQLHDDRTRLVVFSWNSDSELVSASLAMGASGYVSKGVDAAGLVTAIERVHAGEIVVPAQSLANLGEDAFGRWPGDEHVLSPREAEVLALICQGLSNQEITERAFIGINTVKTHIRTLYRKIGVASRTQAVVWGHAHGFRPDHSRDLDP